MRVVRFYSLDSHHYGPILTICDKHLDDYKRRYHMNHVTVPQEVPRDKMNGWVTDNFPWVYELRDINVTKTIEFLKNCIPGDDCDVCEMEGVPR